MGTKELAVAGYREMETNWHFDHNFELPAHTAAVAFSYDGQMGADATGGAEQEFWHDPFQ